MSTKASHGALIVFGSGPGVGRNVAALFAERAFRRILLLSRDSSRLEEDATFVRKTAVEGVRVDAVTIDLSENASVEKALREVEGKLQGVEVEVVLFNAARTAPSHFFEFETADFERDLRIAVTSLYTISAWAIPRLQETSSTIAGSNPALLITSGLLHKQPAPKMFSLAACKAAQYSIANSLHQAYEPQGVHVGVLVIGGTVAEKSEVTNPRNIAEEAWKWWGKEQKGTKGAFEVVLMDPAFAEHVKLRERDRT